MSRFIKTLIIINGILIPVVVLVFFGSFLWNALDLGSRDYNEPGITTENYVVKDNDTLVVQGTENTNPVNIYNSSNYYIEIGAKSYNELPSKTMFGQPINYEGGGYESDFTVTNMLFLNKDMEPIGRLLDKKGYIKATSLTNDYLEQTKDTAIHNIFYLICFTDDNKDGLLNYLDNTDLFMTGLDGKDFTQITSGIDIEQYRIIDKGQKVLITYKKRSKVRDEYKITRYALYTLQTKKLKYLESITSELGEINKILIGD